MTRHGERAAPGQLAVPYEARAIQGHRAGIVTRIVASIVDLLVVLVVLGLIYGFIAGVTFLLNPSSFNFPSGIGWSIPVIGFVIVLPYLAISWYNTGRTFGGELLGLRVVNFRGDRLTFAGAVLRAAICVIFPIGILWVAISAQNRSVADVILRSSVIYDWTARRHSD